MKTVNISLLVGIAILAMVGIVVLASSGVIGGASKYTTFKQAKATGEVVHVVGSWAEDQPYNYDHATDIFSFALRDTSNEVARVIFHDPIPANFGDAERIVIQGKYVGDIFEADRIFMKCPSKYNDEQIMEEEVSAQR